MGVFFSKDKSFLAGDSSLQKYLREISKYPLLSKEEEDAAARAHDYDKLVRSNLRFAVRAAHSFRQVGDLQDLIQWANVGLLKAARSYDPDRMEVGRFIGYAKMFVLTELQRYNRTQNSAYSVHEFNLYRKILKFRNRYFAINSFSPSVYEIADNLGVSVEKVERVLSGDFSTVSSSTPLGEEGEGCLEDTFDAGYETDACVNEGDNRVLADLVLNYKLNRQEAEFARYFYGIGIEKKTVCDIALLLGVTEPRCCQIKKSLSGKLEACKPVLGMV